MSPRTGARRPLLAVAFAFGVLATGLSAVPAAAHGFSSVVYVDANAPDDDVVRTVLELEVSPAPGG